MSDVDEPIVESQEPAGEKFNRQRFLERLLLQCMRVKKTQTNGLDQFRLHQEVGKLMEMLLDYEMSCDPPQET